MGDSVFNVVDTSGTQRTVTTQDKITSVDGDTYEYFINKFKSGSHTRRFKARLVAATTVQITPFSSISGADPTYGTPYTVKAQAVFQEQFKFDKSKGSEIKVADGYIVMLAAKETGKKKQIIKAFFTDEMHGEHFDDQHVVQFISVSTTTNNMGVKVETAASPLTINPIKVEIGEVFFENKEGIKYFKGDAKIVVNRSELELSDITGNHSYFTIATNGGSAVKYYVWGSDAVLLQTHHIEICLKREPA